MKLYIDTPVTISLAPLVTYVKPLSCIGTVIQNYFEISNASYTPSVIPHEFMYNLHIVASGTLDVLLENRAWRILSRPPGNILRLAIHFRLYHLACC
jgi:hypothetical protein